MVYPGLREVPPVVYAGYERCTLWYMPGMRGVPRYIPPYAPMYTPVYTPPYHTLGIPTIS